jgi:hypothetical protein
MITDHTGEPPSWPARPGHIPPRLWLAAVDHVRRHASTTAVFSDLWKDAHKRFLRRVADGARADVFYSLFEVYQLAGGTGSTYDPAAGTAIAGRGLRPETAALLSASSEPIGIERR